MNFFSNLGDYLSDFYDYIFSEKEDQGTIVKGYMSVKNDWIKSYARQAYAGFVESEKTNKETKRQRVQHTLKDFEKYGLSERIINAYNDVVDVLDKLDDVVSRDKHERMDRAQTSLLLGRLKIKGALPLLVSLVDSVSDKKEEGDFSLILKQKGKELLEQLELGILSFLPEQSKGYPIAKASFNFYTINKKPIDYTEKIETINKKLKVDFSELKELKWKGSKELWSKIKTDIEQRSKGKELLLGEMPMRDISEYANLRQILKNILSKQKAKFSELMQKEDSCYSDLQESELYLFDNISEDEFDEYFELTKQIETIATKRNKTHDTAQKKQLRTKLNNLKKERGNLISAACRDTRDMFKAYKEVAEFYRKVAQNHGRFYAQLKAMEKERNESQMVNYWALILQNENKHKLVLIPRNQASDFKIRLKESEDRTSKIKLFWFESFSFRSLQKLCFSNIESGANKFYSDLEKEYELKKKYSFDGKFITGEFQLQGDEQRKIEFYKDVLRSRVASKMLSISREELKDEVLDVDFDSLNDFKVALERVSYKRMFMTKTWILEDLVSDKFNAQVFDITSIDLRHDESCSGKERLYDYTDKLHTQIWKEFWSEENENNNFDIRLCPEITLMYRKPKPSRIVKYGEGSTQRNRYLHEQLTLVTRFTERSNSSGRELAFLAKEQEKKIVEDFNKKVLKENMRFALGIDNGEVELSTLGVYIPEFGQGTNEQKLDMLSDVEKYGFPTLTIKDLKYKETDIKGIDRYVVKNPSYFIKEDLYCRTFNRNHEDYEKMFAELFKSENLLSLDLSTAKMINGHIVTNGDVVSLFNLWKRHAQRNIYDMNEHQKAEGDREVKLKRSNELSVVERRKFIDYLNTGDNKNQKYEKLSEEQKSEYVDWIYNCWNGNEKKNDVFEDVYKKCKRKGNFADIVLYAVCSNSKEVEKVVDVFDIRNIFKFRKDFDCLMSEDKIRAELDQYNVRSSISDEELDLNLKQTKSSLVANVIGVIDFLYNDYKNRFGGDGIIVSEGFGVNKVESDLEKFSGNIYRMLERRLYQKFQSRGLVPPIKNILLFRENDNNVNRNIPFLQIGNICFVDPMGTSQKCPICENNVLNHTESCSKCGFKSKGIMHSNDGIAGYNIAKRGYIEFLKMKN